MFEKTENEEELDEINKKIVDIQNLLLVYAPDETHRAHIRAFAEGQRTKKGKALAELKVLLRKEIFPRTTLVDTDLVGIKFRK